MGHGEAVHAGEGSPRAAVAAEAPRSLPRDSTRSRTEIRPRSHRPGGFLLWCLASLAFGGLGGYLSNHYDEVLSALGMTAGAMERPAHAKVTDPTTEPLNANIARASDLKTLGGRIDKLALETSGLKAQFDSQPKPDECPSLTALQIKVAELTKLADEVAPLTGKIGRSDSRIESLNLLLNGIQQDVEALKTKVFKTAEVSPTTPQPTAIASLGPLPTSATRSNERHEASKPVLRESFSEVSRQALDRGAELFRQEKYKEAFETFSRLELSNPDDARIWYFAALSRGLATRVWGNGTEQLVERGIECERAGTPQATDIDATFRELTSATGKDWLGAYRQRVKDR